MEEPNPGAAALPFMDKANWEPGPWQSEPDRVDFIADGLACLALRHDRWGHFCGYVGVPREHPLYGKPYTELRDLDFHGGITYAEPCEGAICHTPEPGMPHDVWWIGGDFGHIRDKCPGRDAFSKMIAAEHRARGMDETAELFEKTFERDWLRTVYRDLPYVRSEIEGLAQQLAEIARPRPMSDAR